MKAQIIPDMPFAEYLAHPGINAGLLATAFQTCMSKVKLQMDGGKSAQSDELDFGTAFHALVLEGREDFVTHPPTYPAPGGHTKVKTGEIQPGDSLPWTWSAGTCKLFAKENEGRTILSEAEAANVRGMAAVCHNDPELKPLMAGSKSEVTVIVEKDGLTFKIRVDTLTGGSLPVIDFKSARSAEPAKFVKAAYDLGYFLKSALYMDVLMWAGLNSYDLDNKREFWFVAIEKEPPYAHSITICKDINLSYMYVGRRQYRYALQKIKKCLASGEWPAYGSSEAELHAPPWHQKEIEITA